MADPIDTKKSVWLNPFGLAMLAYYLIMAVVGLCIPDDILKANPWAREFSDFMASIVPQIDRITGLGIKPDVNRFYFSVLWAGSPILLGMCLIASYANRSKLKTVWSTPWPQIIFSFIACVAILYFSQTGYGMWDATNRQLKFLLGNSIGRVFWASVLYVHGVVVCSFAVFIWLLGWLTGRIPRNIEKHRHG
jgi:hypothetical protein